MAFKLSLVLLATSLALLIVADASIIRTTVEEIVEENRPSQGCPRIQLNLTPCMKWMKNSGNWDDEIEETMNPSMRDNYKKQCCSMLSRLGDKQECMCSQLESTFNTQCMSRGQSYEGRGGICGEKMPEKLMNVPMKCGLANERCRFGMLLV